MRAGPYEPAAYVGALGEPTTLPAVLDARAERTPDARFVHFDGVDRTYAEAVAGAERAAAGLASLGVAKGGRVALMLPNSLEFLDLWFGAALLGAVLVPVNTALKGEGLRYVLEHSEADVAIVDGPLADTVDAALGGGGPTHRIARGRSGGGWTDAGEILAAGHPPAPRARVRPGDLASILYTSGTTGPPKGVRNCHNAYPTAGYEFTQRYARLRVDDVLYTSLPLFHVNAQMLTTIGSLVSGVPMVLAPRFSASGFFDDLRAHGATVFNYIGAMLTMLYKQPERPDDAQNPARVTIGGAAPAELWPAFEARFGLEILEIYGLTETATFALGSPPDDIRVGKIGLPVSWAEVEVHREDGSVAEAGEPGEIMVRTTRPNVLFQGYDKNDEATARAMAGGWFHTGDRGRRDSDGYFVFLDRLKDSIRRRGENISSYEVERVVNSHPAVAESAAVGVPSELGEDEVMIVLVPRDGAELDPAELVSFCAERMAGFMVPRYVQVRRELPKTATERVQKFALRDEGPAGAWDRMSPTPST
ncbi:MAG: ATP-dependent acyl-CoA ligase [Solirubrobacterales bacterium]|nr:ATP-dependent acyl-CoA ligase [Solirubrobacterales bacterium]